MAKNKLTKEEKRILKLCDEEPGNIKILTKEKRHKFTEDKIKKILARLEKQGLVYKDESVWSTTIEGVKRLSL